jgi:hypothetical protein
VVPEVVEEEEEVAEEDEVQEDPKLEELLVNIEVLRIS